MPRASGDWVTINRRHEREKRGINRRWHVVASDGDFILGFNYRGEAVTTADERNKLGVLLHAEITFEVEDSQGAKTERYQGDPMLPGRTKGK